MIATLHKEAVDYVYKNYPLDPIITYEEVERIFLLFDDKTIVIEDKENIKLVALYLKLSDETVKDVHAGLLDLTMSKNIIECSKMNGNNIHFVLCASKGMRYIREGIREVIKRENPATISWFSHDMNHFFITRRKICHKL